MKLATTALALFVFAASMPAQAVVNSYAEEDFHEDYRPPSHEVQNRAEDIARLGFQTPKLTNSDTARLNYIYSYIDPLGLVPINLKTSALAYYHANRSRIANATYLSIVNFSAHSSQARLFVIDLASGAVLALHVAHGKNSDPSNTGFATHFSNVPNSEESSLGYYLAAETYIGKHGLSLRLDGLSSTNSNVRAREIVLHGADYVHDADVTPGRSWGCLAVPMSDRDQVVAMLKGGSLIYAQLDL